MCSCLLSFRLYLLPAVLHCNKFKFWEVFNTSSTLCFWKINRAQPNWLGGAFLTMHSTGVLVSYMTMHLFCLENIVVSTGNLTSIQNQTKHV